MYFLNGKIKEEEKKQIYTNIHLQEIQIEIVVYSHNGIVGSNKNMIYVEIPIST